MHLLAHAGFLTNATQNNNLIKLTHYDETKKRAHDSQVIRAEENLKLSYGGPQGLKTCLRGTCEQQRYRPACVSGFVMSRLNSNPVSYL